MKTYKLSYWLLVATLLCLECGHLLRMLLNPLLPLQ